MLLPGKEVIFVELKAPEERLRPLQLKRKEQLRKLGFKVYVIDSVQAVSAFMREVVG